MVVVNPNERARRQARIVVAVLLILATGCTETEGNNNDDGDTTPPMPRRDMGQASSEWSQEIVDNDGGGLHLALAVSEATGEIGVAYYPTRGVEDGECSEIEMEPFPLRVRWAVNYASKMGSGSDWTTEEVVNPIYQGNPTGIDLEMTTDGSPVIAAMTGAPNVEVRYCGANNASLITRNAGGGWDIEDAVTESGTAATGEAGSDYGFVVGYHMGLALDPSGNPAVAYKDVHSGSIQSDDRRRADLEFAWKQGNDWQAFPVDFGEGAGDDNQIVFDTDGNPVIAYSIETENLVNLRQGLWVTRSPDGGTTWERVKLIGGKMPERPAITVDDEGTLHVLYYNPELGFPTLATLTDPSNFENVAQGWTIEALGDRLYDEGYAPSMKVSPGGHLTIAYYRCTESDKDLGTCLIDTDGVIFAWRDPGNGEWTYELVDKGTDPGDFDNQDVRNSLAYGFCGQKPSLAFDAAGQALIAYRCEVDDGTGEKRKVSQIKLATRPVLP